MNVFVDGLIFGRQRRGGLSRMWEEFLERLPGLGVDLHLLIPWRADNDSLRRLLAARAKFARVRRDPFFWPRRIFERAEVRSRILARFYLGEGEAIFHSTYYSTVNRAGVRKVVTVPDMILELFADEFPGRWTQLGIEIKRNALANADAVIAISQTTKQDILRIYPGVPAGKITVIPLGVALAKSLAKDSFPEMAARHGLAAAAGEYFLYVGNRDGYKNFSLLPRALSASKNRDLFFVCIGGENSRNEKSRLRQQGLDRHFTFIDHAAEDELQAWYKNARALLFPSRYEGFGLPLIEAMANDCPVLCADTAIFHEIGGVAPVFFDPNSPASLGQALEGFERRDKKELIRRGRVNARRFSWDESARALAQLYRSLGPGA